MIGRIVIGAMAFAVGAAMPIGGMTGALKTDAVVREEDLWEETVVVSEDDDSLDTHDSNSFTSGVDSNDGTNSRVTAVSQDRDRSGGDLTRDRTRDGAGGPKRDWSENRTNDRSRRDTR
jgi:hypothetical protein